MKESAALDVINKKISSVFGSINHAAMHFGVTPQGLEKALKGKQAKIPKYLLDYAGLKMETVYHKVQS